MEDTIYDLKDLQAHLLQSVVFIGELLRWAVIANN